MCRLTTLYHCAHKHHDYTHHCDSYKRQLAHAKLEQARSQNIFSCFFPTARPRIICTAAPDVQTILDICPACHVIKKRDDDALAERKRKEQREKERYERLRAEQLAKAREEKEKRAFRCLSCVQEERWPDERTRWANGGLCCAKGLAEYEEMDKRQVKVPGSLLGCTFGPGQTLTPNGWIHHPGTTSYELPKAQVQGGWNATPPSPSPNSLMPNLPRKTNVKNEGAPKVQNGQGRTPSIVHQSYSEHVDQRQAVGHPSSVGSPTKDRRAPKSQSGASRQLSKQRQPTRDPKTPRSNGASSSSRSSKSSSPPTSTSSRSFSSDGKKPVRDRTAPKQTPAPLKAVPTSRSRAQLPLTQSFPSRRLAPGLQAGGKPNSRSRADSTPKEAKPASQNQGQKPRQVVSDSQNQSQIPLPRQPPYPDLRRVENNETLRDDALRHQNSSEEPQANTTSAGTGYDWDRSQRDSSHLEPELIKGVISIPGTSLEVFGPGPPIAEPRYEEPQIDWRQWENAKQGPHGRFPPDMPEGPTPIVPLAARRIVNVTHMPDRRPVPIRRPSEAWEDMGGLPLKPVSPLMSPIEMYPSSVSPPPPGSVMSQIDLSLFDALTSWSPSRLTFPKPTCASPHSQRRRR